MKVAVLCPGPSAHLYRRSDYALVIGVNRGCQIDECDYAVMRDVMSISFAVPKGNPVIVAADITLRLMRTIYRQRMLARPSETVPPSGEFSAITALKLAVDKGATEVDCYGMTLLGEEDYDGWTHQATNRSAKRWAKERDHLAEQFRAMRAAGVRVRRIRDYPSERELRQSAKAAAIERAEERRIMREKAAAQPVKKPQESTRTG